MTEGHTPVSYELANLNASTGSSSSSERVAHNGPVPRDVNLNIELARDVVLHLDRALGRGAFGTVYRGTYRGKNVAVKMLNNKAAGATDTSEIQALQMELNILSRIQDSHVVKVYGGCMEPGKICVVEELMDCNLADYIQKHKPLPLLDVLRIGRAIAAALAHLHPTVLHRDLKPQNVLLNQQGEVKISDFGLARMKIAQYLSTKEVMVGTPAYMAPECFGAGSSPRVTEKADVYSLGIMLWECITGMRPWEGLNHFAILYKVAVADERPEFGPETTATCPPALRLLVQQLWCTEARLRPSCAEIVERIDSVALEAGLPRGCAASGIASEKVVAASPHVPPPPPPPPPQSLRRANWGSEQLTSAVERQLSNLDLEGPQHESLPIPWPPAEYAAMYAEALASRRDSHSGGAPGTAHSEPEPSMGSSSNASSSRAADMDGGGGGMLSYVSLPSSSGMPGNFTTPELAGTGGVGVSLTTMLLPHHPRTSTPSTDPQTSPIISLQPHSLQPHSILYNDRHVLRSRLSALRDRPPSGHRTVEFMSDPSNIINTVHSDPDSNLGEDDHGSFDMARPRTARPSSPRSPAPGLIRQSSAGLVANFGGSFSLGSGGSAGSGLFRTISNASAESDGSGVIRRMGRSSLSSALSYDEIDNLPALPQQHVDAFFATCQAELDNVMRQVSFYDAERIKQLSVEQVASQWAQHIRDVRQHLQSEPPAPEDAGSSGAATYAAWRQDLENQTRHLALYGHMVGTLNVEAARKLVSVNLETLREEKLGPDKWREVVDGVEFSEAQVQQALLARIIYLTSLKSIHAQKAMLLKALETPSAFLTHGTLASNTLTADEAMTRLQDNMRKRAHINRCLYTYVCWHILTIAQYARVMALSYPYLPDALAMVNLLAGDEQALQQHQHSHAAHDGQPAAPGERLSRTLPLPLTSVPLPTGQPSPQGPLALRDATAPALATPAAVSQLSDPVRMSGAGPPTFLAAAGAPVVSPTATEFGLIRAASARSDASNELDTPFTASNAAEQRVPAPRGMRRGVW